MKFRGTVAGLALLAWVFATAAVGESALNAKTFERAIRQETAGITALTEVRAKANALGLRLWLFGGAASTVAQAVRRRLQHPDAQPLQLDQLFHSAQDIDLVVDGPESAAAELLQWLQGRPPFLPDGRSAWELRQLHHATGPKGPLLGDEDFLRQHSDTQSTGVLALDARDDEPVLRDLAAWENRNAPFVLDSRLGVIHFRWSATHATTPRAVAGFNPPVFAAIRYWMKVLAHDMPAFSRDLRRVQRIIGEFNPEQDLATPYALAWMERNGRKLLLYARNLERAHDVLRETGLGEKLARSSELYQKAHGDEPTTGRTLAQWMSRVPLRGFDIGHGDGPTAESLGLGLVAHETSDFASWEILMRSPNDAPNLFESRPEREDENAYYGAGFYVRCGRRGARATGFTVRFRLKPEAREGSDFVRASTVMKALGKESNGDEREFIVVKNRRALELVRDSDPTDTLGFLQALVDGTFLQDDGGLIEREIRRIVAAPAPSTDLEESMRDIALRPSENATVFLNAWTRLPWAPRYPEVIDLAIARVHFQLPQPAHGPPHLPAWIRTILSTPAWVDRDDAVERFRTLLSAPCPPLQYLEEMALLLASAPWQRKPEWVSLVATALEKSQGGLRHQWLAQQVFTSARWPTMPRASELLLKLIGGAGPNRQVMDTVVDQVLTVTGWETLPEALEILLRGFDETPLTHHAFLIERIDKKLMGLERWQTAPALRMAFPVGKITGGRIQHLWRTQGRCALRVLAGY